MISEGNVAAQQNAKKIEGEDGLKTMECLRGRLLAERGASRVANEKAEQLNCKLNELEKSLRKEEKSRNRAEKRLKLLMKKLESKNLSYVFPDESSDHSSSQSSSSSTASSSYPKPPKAEKKTIHDTQNKKFEKPVKSSESSLSEIMNDSASSTISGESHIIGLVEKNESGKVVSQKSDDSQYSQNMVDLNGYDQRSKSSVGDKGEEYQDWDDNSVDNSMALVPVAIPVTGLTSITTTDPPTANGNVKDVLDTLRFMREMLQSSVKSRHMVRDGFR